MESDPYAKSRDSSRLLRHRQQRKRPHRRPINPRNEQSREPKQQPNLQQANLHPQPNHRHRHHRHRHRHVSRMQIRRHRRYGRPVQHHRTEWRRKGVGNPMDANRLDCSRRLGRERNHAAKCIASRTAFSVYGNASSLGSAIERIH